ncbi:DUF4097 family beta strand repeat-containing protein [Rapidithrix thailandica]|uniref:DUF4097 family beta strand repeat-containing protein n=1 Tax=Rapidithrix thailandica TaxID=413964 RepID=A0AAW9RPZ2_9BACT
MKQFLGIGILWVLALQITYGQTYKMVITNPQDITLDINILNSELIIEGYDGKELIITAEGHEPAPERAKGLKPLYSNVEDNSGIGLSIVSKGNQIDITRASRKSIQYHFKVPRKANITIGQGNIPGEDLHIKNMEGELAVQTLNGDVTLENVSGPLYISSTSGDVVVKFSELNQSKNSAIAAVSGFVDITLPSREKANLKLSSISGEVFTDLSLEFEKRKNGEGLQPLTFGHNTIKASLNGGGVELHVKAISGDIYLRKK